MYIPKITTKQKKLSSRPLVSIIIPTYQYAGCIESAYRSAASQTYENLEILFVDDCSTDDTLLILNDLAKKDRRLRVVQTEKNGGQSVARNLGLASVHGDYICFADVDDFYDSRFIEKTLNAALTYNVPLVCTVIRISYGRLIEITPFASDCRQFAKYKEWSEQREKAKKLFGFVDCNKVILNSRKFWNDCFTIEDKVAVEAFYTIVNGIWGKLYRRDILEGIRFNSDLHYYEDALFSAYVFNKSVPMIIDGDYIGYNKVEHGDSAWHIADTDDTERLNQQSYMQGLLYELSLRGE